MKPKYLIKISIQVDKMKQLMFFFFFFIYISDRGNIGKSGIKTSSPFMCHPTPPPLNSPRPTLLISAMYVCVYFTSVYFLTCLCRRTIFVDLFVDFFKTLFLVLCRNCTQRHGMTRKQEPIISRRMLSLC